MEEAIASSQMEGASTTRKVAKDMWRKKLSPINRYFFLRKLQADSVCRKELHATICRH